MSMKLVRGDTNEVSDTRVHLLAATKAKVLKVTKAARIKPKPFSLDTILN